MAEALALCGRGDEAAGLLAAAWREQPSSELSQLFYEQLKRVPPETVEEIVMERLMAEPESSELHEALHQLYTRTGQPDKLLSHLLAWTELDASNSRPPSQLLVRLSAQGKGELALEFGRQALRRAPDNLDLQERMFVQLVKWKELAEAHSLAQELAAREDRKASRLGRRLMAEVAGESRGAEERLARLQALFTEDPTDWALRQRYLSALAEAGQGEELQRILQQPEAGGAPPRPSLVATRLLRFHQPEAALLQAEAATATLPESPDTWQILGQVLEKLERRDEAEKAYRRALEVAPGNLDSARRLAFLIQARGDSQALLEFIEPLSPTLREDRQLGGLMAAAYLRQERWAEGVTHLQEHLLRHPFDTTSRLNLAWAAKELGDEAAVRHHLGEFLAHSAEFESRAGTCNCSCNIIQQRERARAWLEAH